jgi:3-carboxy-cis,cis-muconate cycloisomerase
VTATPFDSPLHRALWSDAEVARLFTDGAEIRAMLLTLGALARAQGAQGVIPETSAAAIHRAAMEVQIDPAALAEATARDGVPLPALVAAFRDAMGAPEHARWIHHGATSQDIVDTGLALRLRGALAGVGRHLDGALAMLAGLAEAHAETPMAARTYGQVATPTSFGATVAIWGEGLLAVRDALPAVRARAETVTLHGAAGTGAALGPDPAALRAAVADALGLAPRDANPHAERGHIRALAAWLDAALGACAKPATDLLLLARDGDVTLGGAGGSSTMPQKRNPVGPSAIRALALHGRGLALTPGATHWDHRDGGAWFAEWLALPQLVIATARALSLLAGLDIRPDAARLRAKAADPTGLIHAEALSFALDMPRPEAQARIKAWAAEIRDGGGNLVALAGLDPADFAPQRRWGEAPAHARRFAARVRDG